MKATFAILLSATLVAVGAWAAQDPTSTPTPTPPPAPTPGTTRALPEPGPAVAPAPPARTTPPTSVPDPAAAPPVVLVPIARDPGKPAGGAPGEATGSTVSRMPVAGQVRWTESGTALRPRVQHPTGTNPPIDTRSVLPRLTRPERRGFGGFLKSFGNLFNPFAPASEGVAAKGEYWYDGDVRNIPLPRGFQDERYHEPQLQIQVYSLEPRDRTEQKPEPARSTGP